MNKKQFVILILCLLVQSVSAGSEDGGYAGAFLQMAVQARPAGMGGAYFGVSNDAAGQLYNPAGLAGTTQKTFASSYRIMKLDRKLGFATIIIPTKLNSALALSWLYAGYGDVMARNNSGKELGTTISSNEHDFAIAFAKQFTPFLGIGAKLNYYHKKLYTLKANSIGINIGFMMMVDSLFTYGAMDNKPITDINIGLIFNHISAKYPWTSESEELAATQDDKFPIVIGLGGSCRLLDRKLLLAADFEKNTKQNPFIRFGGEYNINNRMYLRSGMNDGAIATGVGFNIDLKKWLLNVDYSYLFDRVDEGNDHIIGFQFRF
jgi:hypothetical protein